MEFKCPRCGAFTILRAMRPCSESPDGQNGALHADSEKKTGK